MSKVFNTAGLCIPERHYMVNMDSRLDKIRKMVDRGEYFVINRARQYGKTTVLSLLKRKLADDYIVLSISFEGMEEEAYAGTVAFCRRVCRLLYNPFLYETINGVPDAVKEQLGQMRYDDLNLADLSDFISSLCFQASKPVVLMIDEVDQAGNQEIFLSFLGMLRSKYMNREEQPAFRSVILAGVHDIKNLKWRVRPEEEHRYNSPWNIAADFNVDMSFSVDDIAGMLLEYEQEHRSGMDISAIAGLLYDYTSGYPFLVSRLCKIMDERIADQESRNSTEWTRNDLIEAVKILLTESNTLFDDMIKKLQDYPALKKSLYAILFNGQRFSYNIDNAVFNIGCMLGFIKESQGTVVISNRIFETRLYNLFLSEEMLDSRI